MTQLKQRAFEMLRDISDEKAVYVIKFMRAIEDDPRAYAENEIAMQRGKTDYELFQEACSFVKDSHDEDALLPDEIPRVHFRDRIEL